MELIRSVFVKKKKKRKTERDKRNPYDFSRYYIMEESKSDQVRRYLVCANVSYLREVMEIREYLLPLYTAILSGNMPMGLKVEIGITWSKTTLPFSFHEDNAS